MECVLEECFKGFRVNSYYERQMKEGEMRVANDKPEYGELQVHKPKNRKGEKLFKEVKGNQCALEGTGQEKVVRD